ncbi:MAG: hypothetical protein IJ759_00515 [Bacteroidales bacterium]|nr:hypothetical protein [Bacteroidales bacterium]
MRSFVKSKCLFITTRRRLNVLFENNTAIKQIQTEKESMQICKHCVEKGVDSIEVSGNGISLVGINEAYFLDFAKKLADEVSIPIILVGGHRSINNMNQILHSMDISFLSMSRPLICEPFLVKRWQENELTPSKCISCNSCYSTFAHRCIFKKTLQN